MSATTIAMPGWDAISSKLGSVYGRGEAKHWGTIMRWAEGGPDPLDGISAYAAERPACWHYVTFGFSELGTKRSADQDVSGWGFELSLRLAREPEESAPPEWPVVFLQKLGRYVFQQKMPFDHEHFIAWGGPITKDVETKLAGVIFANDPVLGEIRTPNGSVKFLTAMGITAEEHEYANAEGPEKLVAMLMEGNAAGVVEMGRESVV